MKMIPDSGRPRALVGGASSGTRLLPAPGTCSGPSLGSCGQFGVAALVVQQAFDTLARGRTTITIAHRLSTVRNADQIIVLDHGGIIEAGDHTSLLAGQGRYAELAA